MKQWIFVIAAALCLVGAAVALGSYRDYGGYDIALEANWDFALPRRGRCTELYQAYRGGGFHGDGFRYHVYECHNSPVSSMYDWESDERETVFHESVTAAAEDLLDQLDVPEQWRPDPGRCVRLYRSHEDNSELIVLWDADAERLFVLESFL